MARIATKACIPCRDRKRKCDRTTPTCSLCYRLGRSCQYEGRVGLISSPPGKVMSNMATTTLIEDQIHLPKTDPSITSSFNTGQLLKLSISNAVTENLSRAVGDLCALRKVVGKYFSTIHMWYPIISENEYYERLPSVFTRPCADFSLLGLSIALITTIPPESEEWGLLSSLYMLVKSSIAVVEASNINNLYVVQARLLVALFETGHDIEPAAYISIASTARAAAAIGLHRNHLEEVDKLGEVSEISNERDRVWWGIVMLDRNYTLERGEGLGATHDLGSPQHLPRDGSIRDHAMLFSPDPLPLSTPSSMRVGPFARQAQVSHVLSILILHLREEATSSKFNKEESDQLARTLTAFSMLLPEDSPQPWPRYCGAMGMCYNGLMTLHDSRPQPVISSSSPKLCSTTDPESLGSTLRRLNQIATKFNTLIGQVNFDAMSPFPPHGLARGSEEQYRIWKATGDVNFLASSDQLILMVRHFSKRWVKARKLSKRLEEGRKGCENIAH